MTALSRRTFLAASAAALATATTARAEEAAKYWVFIGTGTSKAGSKGIYRCEFDSATGKLGEPVLAAEVASPTFLAIHPSKKYLYCVGEVSSFGGKKAGGVHAFSLDAKSGELKKLNDSDSGGPGPCHIICDHAGECLLVANYSGGSVKCLKLNADGSIGTESTFIQHTGKSVNPGNQEGPHAHSSNVSPDNRFAIVADLGIDKLMIYKLDAKAAKLTANDPPSFDMPPGTGPRHFAWHPNGQWAYCNGEINATVTALKYDAKAGTFTKINSVSTLPSDVPADIRKANSTAEVVVHPNGTILFVSNRGHDSLAVFEIHKSGELSAAGHITGDIAVPRNFNIDPSGHWILIANQQGNSVILVGWDPEKNVSIPSTTKIGVSRPMCIKFVAVN